MRAQRFGRIVAITSIAARQPIPNLILSNTARAGATGFLKTLAREVAAHGVTVNSVQPGAHATQALTDVYGPDLAEVAKDIPPERVVRVRRAPVSSAAPRTSARSSPSLLRRRPLHHRRRHSRRRRHLRPPALTQNRE